MTKYLDFLESFNSITVIIRLALAAMLGGCIGLEREKYKRPAGFRTHILVCIEREEELGIRVESYNVEVEGIGGLFGKIGLKQCE